MGTDVATPDSVAALAPAIGGRAIHTGDARPVASCAAAGSTSKRPGGKPKRQSGAWRTCGAPCGNGWPTSGAWGGGSDSAGCLPHRRPSWPTPDFSRGWRGRTRPAGAAL